MYYAGWILFALAAAAAWWYRGQVKLGYARRQDLCCYAIHLLLHDDVREANKARFREWIRAEQVESPMALALRGQFVVEDVAASLSGSSTLGAMALVSDVKWPKQEAAAEAAEATATR